MSKLVYPSSGIYPRCKGNIAGCIEELSSAIANCDYTVPSGFPHREYLYSLDGTLNNCLAEIKEIESKLKNTDSSFNNLSNSLTANASKISIEKVNKRDRMII